MIDSKEEYRQYLKYRRSALYIRPMVSYRMAFLDISTGISDEDILLLL